MLSSGGEWKDCGGPIEDLNVNALVLVMKLFIRKNTKVIPSGGSKGVLQNV